MIIPPSVSGGLVQDGQAGLVCPPPNGLAELFEGTSSELLKLLLWKKQEIKNKPKLAEFLIKVQKSGS